MIKNEFNLYERGKDNIWTDPHVSKEMLAVHLDGAHDAASRKLDSIETTVHWIKNTIPAGSKILDLGCGVGLYSQQLAKAGYIVHGVDINRNSIEYAESQTDDGLSLSYQCANYLDLTLSETYDAIIMSIRRHWSRHTRTSEHGTRPKVQIFGVTNRISCLRKRSILRITRPLEGVMS